MACAVLVGTVSDRIGPYQSDKWVDASLEHSKTAFTGATLNTLRLGLISLIEVLVSA